MAGNRIFNRGLRVASFGVALTFAFGFGAPAFADTEEQPGPPIGTAVSEENMAVGEPTVDPTPTVVVEPTPAQTTGPQPAENVAVPPNPNPVPVKTKKVNASPAPANAGDKDAAPEQTIEVPAGPDVKTENEPGKVITSNVTKAPTKVIIETNEATADATFAWIAMGTLAMCVVVIVMFVATKKKNAVPLPQK